MVQRNQRHHDISIVLAGAAGKGVQTVEGILLSVLKNEGYFLWCRDSHQ